jgi:plastocyanin
LILVLTPKIRKVAHKNSKAISNMVAVVVIIVIIIVAAGSLLVFTQSPKSATSSTTSTGSSISTTGETSTAPSTSVYSNVSSSSTVSSSSSAIASTSSSLFTGRLLLSFADPNAPLVASNINLTYPIKVTSLGNLPPVVVIQPISSNGISITFSPNNVSLGSQASVVAVLSVGHNVTPGTYNFQAEATGGGSTFNSSLSIQVVQYLVAIEPAFTPANITVTQGSTVTWVRLNGVLGEHGDNGSQNVVFNNGMAQSPQLAQYASWSYVFTQTGNFPYHSTYRTDDGEVTVVSA